MDADHALHHLTEVRDAVDDEMAEYVDTIARLVALNQSITDPMLGAKVTVYQQAPTTLRREEKAALPDGFVEEAEDRDDIRSANEYEDDGTPMVSYYEWDYPDQPKVIPVEGIVFDANVAEQEEQMYDPSREEYRTGDDYPLGTVNAVIPSQWVDAVGGDYPEGALFSEGYCSKTEDATSLVPRSKGQKKYAYEPGWEAAQKFHLGADAVDDG